MSPRAFIIYYFEDKFFIFIVLYKMVSRGAFRTRSNLFQQKNMLSSKEKLIIDHAIDTLKRETHAGLKKVVQL